MTARFYAPDAHAVGETVTLPRDEAGHLIRVLRLAPGDAVRIFNGTGGEFDAFVAGTSRRLVHVTLGDRRTAAPEAAVAITLAPAVLKGDKMDEVVRDAVMMGAVAIQPLVSARTEVTLPALERARRRERWQRVAVASAKQCGRAVVPAILQPCTFAAAGAAIAESRLPTPALMFVEPNASTGSVSLSEVPARPPREATVVVGPEGGWSPDEIAQGAATCRLVTLRAPTLRADAMPVVALAGLFARWGEL